MDQSRHNFLRVLNSVPKGHFQLVSKRMFRHISIQENACTKYLFVLAEMF